MSQKSKPEFTESMIEFGRYMKFLRCPDIHSFKVKILEKNEGRLGPSHIHEFLESDSGVVDDLFPDEVLPDNFRDLQQKAKRYKVKMYSLREISDIMGISKNTLHDYERGKRYPPIEFIYDYSEIMKISVDPVLEYWLLNHPNENISLHTEKTLEEHYYHQLSVHHRDERRVQARGFFKAALRYSLLKNEVKCLSEVELVGVSNLMSEVIDKTLAQGLNLEPKNIHKGAMLGYQRSVEKFNL